MNIYSISDKLDNNDDPIRNVMCKNPLVSFLMSWVDMKAAESINYSKLFYVYYIDILHNYAKRQLPVFRVSAGLNLPKAVDIGCLV